MANYANQQIIKVGTIENIKHHEGASNSFLVALDWAPLMDVMLDLSPTELKLWFYLWKWRGSKDGYYFSPADIEKQIGISESTTRRAKTILIQKKYLVNTKTNCYDFIPFPEGVHERAELLRVNTILKRNGGT